MTAMIGRDQQSLTMANMAATRSGDAGVQKLAARIAATESPQVAQMQSWMRTWGQGDPTGSGSMMSASSGSMMSASPGSMMSASPGGMMSATQMSGLAAMSGDTFDHSFLELMTNHHRATVAAARAEVQDGRDPRAMALARTIITARTAQMEEMGRLAQATGP